MKIPGNIDALSLTMDNTDSKTVYQAAIDALPPVSWKRQYYPYPIMDKVADAVPDYLKPLWEEANILYERFMGNGYGTFQDPSAIVLDPLQALLKSSKSSDNPKAQIEFEVEALSKMEKHVHYWKEVVSSLTRHITLFEKAVEDNSKVLYDKRNAILAPEYELYISSLYSIAEAWHSMNGWASPSLDMWTRSIHEREEIPLATFLNICYFYEFRLPRDSETDSKHRNMGTLETYLNILDKEELKPEAKHVADHYEINHTIQNIINICRKYGATPEVIKQHQQQIRTHAINTFYLMSSLPGVISHVSYKNITKLLDTMRSGIHYNDCSPIYKIVFNCLQNILDGTTVPLTLIQKKDIIIQWANPEYHNRFSMPNPPKFLLCGTINVEGIWKLFETFFNKEVVLTAFIE